MIKTKDLPAFCRLIDAVITEIAEEQGREPEEVKEAILVNIEETR
jgi:hypothetical protein